jgi:hypothetical protein
VRDLKEVSDLNEVSDLKLTSMLMFAVRFASVMGRPLVRLLKSTSAYAFSTRFE